MCRAHFKEGMVAFPKLHTPRHISAMRRGVHTAVPWRTLATPSERRQRLPPRSRCSNNAERPRNLIIKHSKRQTQPYWPRKSAYECRRKPLEKKETTTDDNSIATLCEMFSECFQKVSAHQGGGNGGGAARQGTEAAQQSPSSRQPAPASPCLGTKPRTCVGVEPKGARAGRTVHAGTRPAVRLPVAPARYLND